MRIPTLSVTLPNYNHGHYLHESLLAIVTQSAPPLEVIVVDDASTDNSVAVIEQLARQYPCIRLLRNDVNRGVLFSLDKAMRHARGDYILNASADDRVLPGFFELALRMAARYPQAGLIFGQITVVDNQGRFIYSGEASAWQKPQYVSPERYLTEYLDYEAPTNSLFGSTIYRRSAFEAVGGFRPELGSWLDTFAARAMGLRFGACYIPQPFLMWRVEPNSVSQSQARDLKKMFRMINRAAALMCSPDFSGYFPARHVRRWQRGYRVSAIEQYLLSFLGYSLVMSLGRQQWLRRLRTWFFHHLS